jgi:hypothetical protein
MYHRVGIALGGNERVADGVLWNDTTGGNTVRRGAEVNADVAAVTDPDFPTNGDTSAARDTDVNTDGAADVRTDADAESDTDPDFSIYRDTSTADRSADADNERGRCNRSCQSSWGRNGSLGPYT